MLYLQMIFFGGGGVINDRDFLKEVQELIPIQWLQCRLLASRHFSVFTSIDYCLWEYLRGRTLVVLALISTFAQLDIVQVQSPRGRASERRGPKLGS